MTKDVQEECDGELLINYNNSAGTSQGREALKIYSRSALFKQQ